MQIELPSPHPKQITVIQQSKRFNVLCCGRRWGKTIIGLDRIVAAAFERKKPVAWFAPTYKLLDQPFRTLMSTLRPITKRLDQQKHVIELVGGAVVECWSLDDPDAGRGRAYSLAIVDEAALVQNFERAWQETIRPMLTDYQGSAWFLSTPKGIANYFHTLYQRGLDPQSPEWASWQMPSGSNPYLAETEIEAARGDLTDLAFAQEYLAQFVTWAGVVFRRILDAVKPITPQPAAQIGVDWGRTGDYTVFTAISASGEVLAIDRFRGIEYALQRDRLRQFWRMQGEKAWVIAERNAMGDPIVEQLQRDGLPVIPFLTTGPSKAAAVQALALAFEQGAIKIPNDPVLIGELQAFEGKPAASGMMKYGAPAGLHDDCVMALAMAWAGLLRPTTRTGYLDLETGGMSSTPKPYTISAI